MAKSSWSGLDCLFIPRDGTQELTSDDIIQYYQLFSDQAKQLWLTALHHQQQQQQRGVMEVIMANLDSLKRQKWLQVRLNFIKRCSAQCQCRCNFTNTFCTRHTHTRLERKTTFSDRTEQQCDRAAPALLTDEESWIFYLSRWSGTGRMHCNCNSNSNQLSRQYNPTNSILSDH